MPKGIYIRTQEHKQKTRQSLKNFFTTHDSPCLGRLHTEEERAKMRGKRFNSLRNKTCFQKGHIPWNQGNHIACGPKGIPCAELTKEKIRQSEKGRHLSPTTEFKKGEHKSPATEFTSEVVKLWWQNPEYRSQVIAGRLRNRKPTGPEKQFLKIVEKYSLPFKYTGDGSFILERMNPDFVNINGKKIAIDIFGDYWHEVKAYRENYTEEGRKRIFAKYGWTLIVIWEHELKKFTEEEIARRVGHEV